MTTPDRPVVQIAWAFAGMQALLARLIEELARFDGRGEGASPADSFVAAQFGGRSVLVEKGLTPEREQAWRSTEHTSLWSLYWREPETAGCDPADQRAWYVSLDKGADGPLHLWVRRVYGRATARAITDWMIEVNEAVGQGEARRD